MFLEKFPYRVKFYTKHGGSRIVMISQKPPFTESDVNEKQVYYVIYEEKLLCMAFETVTMKKT